MPHARLSDALGGVWHLGSGSLPASLDLGPVELRTARAVGYEKDAHHHHPTERHSQPRFGPSPRQYRSRQPGEKGDQGLVIGEVMPVGPSGPICPESEPLNNRPKHQTTNYEQCHRYEHQSSSIGCARPEYLEKRPRRNQHAEKHRKDMRYQHVCGDACTISCHNSLALGNRYHPVCEFSRFAWAVFDGAEMVMRSSSRPSLDLGRL